MSDSKNIHLGLGTHDGTHLASLGNGLTIEQAALLLIALRNTPMPLKSCWQDMHFAFNAQEDKQRGGSGLIYDTMKITSAFDSTMKMPCGACNSNPASNSCPELVTCRDRIAAGQCKDDFVRKTIGAVLWPQHYAKLKQR